MNIDDRPTTDLRAYSHILGKFQMAITLQRVNRSPSCLVLVGFSWTADPTAPFPVDQIQDGGRRPSWKTSNGHISVTRVDRYYRNGDILLITLPTTCPHQSRHTCQLSIIFDSCPTAVIIKASHQSTLGPHYNCSCYHQRLQSIITLATAHRPTISYYDD